MQNHTRWMSLVLAVAAVSSGAAEKPAPEQWPKIPILKVDESKPPAFAEAAEAVKAFKVPKGLQISAFAAEPQLVSPVAISVDPKGRVYVVETFRAWGNGGIDMRKFMHWLDEDLAARTVEDRVAWVKKVGGPSAENLTLDSDRVRLIEDTDGDGKADKATVFTDGYNRIEDGIAAGVMAHKGEVYFANMPSLYLLKDTDGDGKADDKKVVSTGYGVHFQFLGHDLHGMTWGPDGKLYFSIGDRGAHVKTKEGKTIDNPDSGAVFRADADGSNLEMVANGLRNPQELQFDDYGNLISADNNCDMGDMARWVYIVEGGDTGWRCGYQFVKEPNLAGPWNAENLWKIESERTAAWSLPAIGYAPPGPSGLAYYPGTGLGDAYKGKFFLCDFRGGNHSGVWTVSLKPKGATFELAEKKQWLWNLLPTDVEFGVDGSVYVSDWVTGWFRPMKGRIWKLSDPQQAQSAIVAETRKLLTDGVASHNVDDLVKLLAHADKRVRQEAQFELAKRGKSTTAALQKRAAEEGDRLARIHAMWALGQQARTDAKAVEPLVKVMDDGDAEIRAQAARVLGDAKFPGAYDALVKYLKDETARVRFFAAIGLGKLGKPTAVKGILQMIRENGDRDPYLRHAGVMALQLINDKASLEAAAKDESPSARLAALLVMRRTGDANVAQFLNDATPLLVEEAARAINDEVIDGAMPQLAAMVNKRTATRPVWIRAINANLRLGGAANAAAVGRFAADPAASPEAREEALVALANWANPSGRDRVTGLWRPASPRDATIATKDAAEAAKPLIADILKSAPEKVKIAAIGIVEKLKIDADQLAGVVADKEQPAAVRTAALKAMEALQRPELADSLRLAFDQGKGTSLRREAITIMMHAPDAATVVGGLFKGGDVGDRKAVLEALGTGSGGVGDSILGNVMDTLIDGTLPKELQLDLLEAAAKSKSKDVLAKLDSYEKKRDPNDPLAGWAETLHGGDAERGKKIYLEKGSVSCVRCHKVGGDQVVVGPDLSGIGQAMDRRYLLESIVKPNAQIAQGFESVVLKLKGNMTVSGVLKKETPDAIILADVTEGEQEVFKEDVLSRDKGLSAMPEGMDKLLNKREMRDVIEFLASLKPGVKVEPPSGHGQ